MTKTGELTNEMKSRFSLIDEVEVATEVEGSALGRPTEALKAANISLDLVEPRSSSARKTRGGLCWYRGVRTRRGWIATKKCGQQSH